MNANAPATRSSSGYRKGQETRAHILAVALVEFGLKGYSAATTRQIADQAGVNLPALTYYFGGKEGLYLACAQDIVERYRDGVGTVANVATHALAQPMKPAEAAALLKRLMAALARFLLSSGEASHRTLFVQREIASPGPAFEILYAALWQPGIELAAELIAHARGHNDDARLRAVMMISSLTGLVEGRDIVARTISKGDQSEAAIAILDEQIDRMT
jgi:AcrR family transcriptional regulator